MSLVAYGSSDESSDEESACQESKTSPERESSDDTTQQAHTKLCLPVPKHDIVRNNPEKFNNDVETNNVDEKLDKKIHFEKLPKPKPIGANSESIVEEDDIPPKKGVECQSETTKKKDRAPVKITVPSLTDFHDVDEENEKRKNKIMPSVKGTGLFALLPPPKGNEVKSTNNLIPRILNKATEKTNQTVKRTQVTDQNERNAVKSQQPRMSLCLPNYDSNSEDEDTAVNSTGETVTDFFALSATTSSVTNESLVDPELQLNIKKQDVIVDALVKRNLEDNTSVDNSNRFSANPNKMLISNIMNLPKEEILFKNKAEVGPKLPVPEQEYNIDTEGNVAFDEKAIEYLCGKRGVKRKNKEIDEANIIEISGEDIKPDEREWLVKALTEEPVARPVSMQGGGVNSQSKKKHQITYLAHQAKAMEMELKNQWAQNRMTRKQTQSKYGF